MQTQEKRRHKSRAPTRFIPGNLYLHRPTSAVVLCLGPWQTHIYSAGVIAEPGKRSSGWTKKTFSPGVALYPKFKWGWRLTTLGNYEPYTGVVELRNG